MKKDSTELPSIEELKDRIEKAGGKLTEKKFSGAITERLKLFSNVIKIQRENGLSYPAIAKLIESETSFKVSSQTIRKFDLKYLHANKPKKNSSTNNNSKS